MRVNWKTAISLLQLTFNVHPARKAVKFAKSTLAELNKIVYPFKPGSMDGGDPHHRSSEVRLKTKRPLKSGPGSALGGNRTHTPFGTWPSTMPVCQFQHQRNSKGIIIGSVSLSSCMAGSARQNMAWHEIPLNEISRAKAQTEHAKKFC